jgi:hypothetical protein
LSPINWWFSGDIKIFCAFIGGLVGERKHSIMAEGALLFLEWEISEENFTGPQA